MNNNTLLITGGKGFIGTSLTKFLIKNGFTNVISVDSKDYNLTNRLEVKKLFEDTNPKYVIHLAAKVGGIASIKAHPADYYYENMLMCTHVLDECCRNKVKKLVAIGTNCSYPENIAVPFKEDDLFNGFPQAANASYGIVKRSFYQQCVAYKEQYGQEFIYLIPTNAYGPYDHFDENSGHVIPSMIKKFLKAIKENSQITLWGSGNATREFMYIDDICKYIMNAFLYYNSTMPLNIGTGIETSIKELAQTIAELTNYQKEINWDTTIPEGYLRKCLDNTRMKEYIGEINFTPLNIGLEKTVNWAIENDITTR